MSRPRRRIDMAFRHLTVLASFVAVSVVFFGVPVLRDLRHSYIGVGTDPSLSMWFFVWWPYAFMHGLNPFLTPLIWAPAGFNLAWATGVPGISMVAAPITMTAGPVVAYNIVCLLAPPLSAWTAYLLSNYITKAFWPSIAAGYVFGFSTYELGHMTSGHIELIVAFVIPLAVYFILLRLDDRMRPATFVILLTLALVAQFLTSMEVLATMTIFGTFAMLLAFAVVPGAIKKRLRSIAVLIISCYMLAAVVLSPYLYYVFSQGLPPGPIHSPERFSSHPSSFLLPTEITYITPNIRWTAFRDSPQQLKYAVAYDEDDPYMGLPIYLIVILFGLTHWRRPVGKLLLIMLVFICVASLGPTLRVQGVFMTRWAWRLTGNLPLINHALPARFMLYAFLVVSIIVGMWASAPETRRWTKWILIPLSVLFLLPNLSFPTWQSTVDTPSFFTSGAFKRYISQGENTLIIPYGPNGNSMLWQAQTGMFFRMAGGYPESPRPIEYQRWPIVNVLLWGERALTLRDTPELKAFLRAHDVKTVIIDERQKEPDAFKFRKRPLHGWQEVKRPLHGWQEVLSMPGARVIRTEGVILYRPFGDEKRPGSWPNNP